MRNLKITIVILFLVVAIAFCVLFVYDRLMIDRVAPVIVCDGEPLEVSVSASDRELCAGLTASDNLDGDLTDRIVVRRVSQLVGKNSAYVYYAVFDSASNYCTYTRIVYYTDYEKPHFSLTQPMIYTVGSPVLLSDRLFASDVLDGDISARIRIGTSTVTTTVAGEYPITVQVTNSAGDTAIVPLIVTMQSYTAQHPVIQLSDYLIYLQPGEVDDLDDLREYIESARTSASGALLDPAEISVSGSLNPDAPGSYHVTFSYTNSAELTYSVIQTVIVE